MSRQQRAGSSTRPDKDEVAARADDLALDGVRALMGGSVWALDDAVVDLVTLAHATGGRAVVEQTLTTRLRLALDERWRTGWQPMDLHHLVGRSARHVRAEPETVTRVVELLGDVMAADLAAYPRASVEQRWHDQLELAEASVWWSTTDSCLTARVGRWGSEAIGYEVALRLEHVLRSLPAMQQLGARPGEATSRSASAPVDVDDKVLARVRQLLAKAESTPYEAEAETFTAGAQALMARHSIDHAVLAASAPVGGDERPDGRRLWMETPYVREKVMLLGAVAEANRSRSVWAKEDGYVTLLGFPHDLDAVETLYTSLLVQATRAMHAEGKRLDWRGGSRTRSFRQSFLAAFGARIGERLAEVTAAETAQAAEEMSAAGGRELVPVLQERTEAVEAYVEELFPRVRHVSMSLGRDREGWDRGRRAADQASLQWGRAVGS
ncbi:DUF2786 domain-containing protein [uncultured Arsenicicoccus sp.]|uniref:DUF2786 domain-containing protein n=1 Tax=uncultured Arsenicicoccus sp. TaxID=491339 RepID=UPI002593E310|nr:DUF2786 domain-containing protein [uncultured Arsenicicoccus sp.]